MKITRKDLQESARKLDHLGMEALWAENRRLRSALEHTMDHVMPDDDCEECRDIAKLLGSPR